MILLMVSTSIGCFFVSYVVINWIVGIIPCVVYSCNFEYVFCT